jgi:hypothetical protein
MKAPPLSIKRSANRSFRRICFGGNRLKKEAKRDEIHSGSIQDRQRALQLPYDWTGESGHDF